MRVLRAVNADPVNCVVYPATDGNAPLDQICCYLRIPHSSRLTERRVRQIEQSSRPVNLHEDALTEVCGLVEIRGSSCCSSH